ncbi:MAG: CapA family protein [Clostridia bacterium]|nr:CapA family protein [Clostridia bacterium]
MIKRILLIVSVMTGILLYLLFSDSGTAKSEGSNIEKAERKAAASIETKKKEQDITIKISFAGDCTIGTDEKGIPYKDSFPYVLKQNKNDYDYFFKKVKPVFEKDDLTIVNLEGTFTTATKMARKKWRFKGDPSYVNIVKSGSIEMVNISNNHIYDFLTQGYNDTLKALKSKGILYSGEGHTEYYKTKNTTIASIGFNGWDTTIKKRLGNSIKTAKKKADIIIVSLHWGKEYTNYPNAVQTELGRYSIDSGADIVVGHHPHVIQGIEYYKGKYIVYSLGNFCFGGNPTPPDKDCIIFQNTFTFKEKKMSKSEGEILPCSVSTSDSINNFQPVVLEGEEGKRVLDRIYTYSKKLHYGIKK